MKKPLRGLRVLDLSLLLPGPFCGKVLADLGARVTKVELPQLPDRARKLDPELYRRVNGAKKALALDYAKPSGKKRLFALLKTADVLLEGFRPGLLERLGLGPQALAKPFPRLVYCSISGYGSQGSRRGGHDLNYEALAGLLEGGRTPHLPAADLSGSLYAVIGILAALRERDKTGRGGYVDISMTACAATLSFPSLMSQLRSTPFYRLYPCKDGRQVAVAALEPAPAVWLLKELGLEALENAPKKTLERVLELTFLSKTRDQWAALLQDKEVCVTPVLSAVEADKRLRGIPL